VTVSTPLEWEECLSLVGECTVQQPLRLALKKQKGCKRWKNKEGKCKEGQCWSRRDKKGARHVAESFFYGAGKEQDPKPERYEEIKSIAIQLLSMMAPEWVELGHHGLPPFLRSAVQLVNGSDVDINIARLAEVASAFALQLFDSRQYDQALQLLVGSFQIEPAANKMYNIACCHALMGKQAEALKALKQSIALGWSDFEHMAKDTDFANLRETKEFQAILRGSPSIPENTNAEELRSNEVPSSNGINSLLHSLNSILTQASSPVTESHQPMNLEQAEVAEPLPCPPSLPVEAPLNPTENSVNQVAPIETPVPIEIPVHQAVAPVPVVAEERLKFFEEMLILRGMGFNDVQANLVALETVQGNVPHAIDRLLA